MKDDNRLLTLLLAARASQDATLRWTEDRTEENTKAMDDASIGFLRLVGKYDPTDDDQQTVMRLLGIERVE